jgi:hypothetical protein
LAAVGAAIWAESGAAASANNEKNAAKIRRMMIPNQMADGLIGIARLNRG